MPGNMEFNPQYKLVILVLLLGQKYPSVQNISIILLLILTGIICDF